MKKRMLRDIKVSEVGMGCMAFSHGYGKIPEEQYSIEAIRNAYNHSCTFFVPFSPIASGLLSGKITPQTQFERNDDVRNWVPQLSRRNIEGNQPIVEMLKSFAGKKKATLAQISLAWMLNKYPNVVPIPGSKNKDRIIENLDSATVELTEEEFEQLESSLNGLKVYGHRGLGGF